MRRGVFVLISLLGMRLAAADPKFEYGKKDDVKDVHGIDWLAAAEAGIVLTTGNSETTTASGGIKVSRKSGDNKLALEASGAYAKSGVRVINDMDDDGIISKYDEIKTVDTITAETLAGKLRYDRFLTDFNSLYIAALASRDVPAGKESVFGGQAGYSRRLYKSDTAETVAEIGYDFSRENPVIGPTISIHSGRVYMGHKAVFTQGAQLDANIEILTNLNREDLVTTDENYNKIDGGPLKDTRVNTKLAISAKIGINLAFQTSLELKYDNRPGPLPVEHLADHFQPEASRIDTIMKVSFIYTFVGAKAPDKK